MRLASAKIITYTWIKKLKLIIPGQTNIRYQSRLVCLQLIETSKLFFVVVTQENIFQVGGFDNQITQGILAD